LNKKIIIVIGAAMVMFACGAPSEAAIQNELVQTKVAETVMQNAIQAYIAQTQVAWTPTSTIAPPSAPTSLLPQTATDSQNITYATATSESDCLFWEDINATMEGQYRCVFGRVAIIDLQNNGMYFYFEDKGTSFYFILLKQGSSYYVFPNVQIGNCVQTKGTIKTFMGIPRIETEGSIIYWHSDQYNCD